MGLPYRTILTLACVVLTIRYAFESTEPARWRWGVGALTTLSFVLPDGLAWYVAGVLAQLSAGVFVILRGIVTKE